MEDFKGAVRIEKEKVQQALNNYPASLYEAEKNVLKGKAKLLSTLKNGFFISNQDRYNTLCRMYLSEALMLRYKGYICKATAYIVDWKTDRVYYTLIDMVGCDPVDIFITPEQAKFVSFFIKRA